ncbi:MAG: putative baseplate assembly protein [Acidobacteriota bacterium]
MSATCSCCTGVAKITPRALLNRPGLGAIGYRVGTHATFLETMKARLSNLELSPEDLEGEGPFTARELRPLLALTSREPSDPAIALLDSWAVVADVLAFYQERIANEGYLRTAVERRSILELARLIGYRPRPGVAASVYLAFTLEKDSRVVIPAGTRAQSIPGDGELPQPFETSDDVAARTEWNLLTPRMTRPQTFDSAHGADVAQLYLQGVTTKLKQNDPLLLVFSDAANQQFLRRVRSVEPDTAANRTLVRLVVPPKSNALSQQLETAASLTQQIALRYSKAKAFGIAQKTLVKGISEEIQGLQDVTDQTVAGSLEAKIGALRRLGESVKSGSKAEKSIAGLIAELTEVMEMLPPDTTSNTSGPLPGSEHPTPHDLLLAALEKEPSAPPANATRLSRVLQPDADNLLIALRPALTKSLYQALANFHVPQPPPVRVFALRITAPLFGYNATAARPMEVPPTGPEKRWHVVETILDPDGGAAGVEVREETTAVHLDNSYESILSGSWVAIEIPATEITDAGTLVARAGNVKASIGRAVYGVAGKTTRVELRSPADNSKLLPWLNPNKADPPIEDDFDAIRRTVVHAQSEELTLADEPIAESIGGDRIPLDTLVAGLEAGRWLMVSGERTDIPHVAGVEGTELVMIGGVEKGPTPLPPGGRLRSTLVLANELSYRYRRDAVAIYGNVAAATHGETHAEVLGSGDAARAMQKFELRQRPLTWLSAATPSGAESTLQVRVDDVLWHEADSFVGLGPKDRNYVTRTDDDDKTAVVFGNGTAGARVPTGGENVTSVYRTGIGAVGNVGAGQISQLATRPLGVKSVINPMPAIGGGDRETRDQARRNAPLEVTALDRLVSVKDFEDFARRYAGIAKASAALVSDGRREVVHLTVAGTGDIPIAPTSDLFINLRKTLRAYGDPLQAFQLAVRKLQLLVIRANVRLLPDYRWESVEPKIRAALLDAFSFERRELGQDALPSEVLSVMQAQPGVAFVDLDVFDSVAETTPPNALKTLSLKTRVRVSKAKRASAIGPLNILLAELAYLSAALPDTLILTERPR